MTLLDLSGVADLRVANRPISEVMIAGAAVWKWRALLDAYLMLLFAAFSFRLLSSTYPGPCIRVRRSTDNGLRDFSFAAGWLDVAQMLAWVTEQSSTASGYVVTWYDQSGNGRDITQPTAALQRRIVNAGVLEMAPNGRPVMTGGAGALLSASLASGMPVGANNLSIVVASALTMAQGAGLWRVAACFGGSVVFSDPGLGINSGNQFAAVALGGGAAGIVPSAAPAMRFCAVDFKSGATATTYLDGATAGPVTFAHSIATPGRLAVGGRPSGGVNWYEPLGEVLFLNGTTPDLRSYLRANYQAAWGTP